MKIPAAVYVVDLEGTICSQEICQRTFKILQVNKFDRILLSVYFIFYVEKGF